VRKLIRKSHRPIPAAPRSRGTPALKVFSRRTDAFRTLAGLLSFFFVTVNRFVTPLFGPGVAVPSDFALSSVFHSLETLDGPANAGGALLGSESSKLPSAGALRRTGALWRR